MVYGAVQQNYRQSLNDPQIQLAEDAAVALQNGGAPANVILPQTVDIGASLSPWVGVYDAQGNPLAASGRYHGALPTPPAGIFTNFYPKGNLAQRLSGASLASDRVTWQAPDGTRQALIVVPVPGKNEFAVAGRNMREVEDRERQLIVFLGIAWLVTLSATFLAALFAEWTR